MVTRFSTLRFLASLAVALVIPVALHAQDDGKLHILLLGDSTTEGSIPRLIDPKAPTFESTVTDLLAKEKDLPPSVVINKGLSGEFIQRLLTQRYDKAISKLGHMDYIFVRYGINDNAKRQDFAVNFPKDYHELIAKLHRDFPKATIILTTNIPFSSPEASAKMNALVKQVADEEKLPFFDLYPLYDAVLKRDGVNKLNYRRFALDKVPENLRELVKPYVRGKPPTVQIMADEFDAQFAKVPGWTGDRHPNAAGYKLIGEETVKFLLPLIRKQAK